MFDINIYKIVQLRLCCLWCNIYHIYWLCLLLNFIRSILWYSFCSRPILSFSCSFQIGANKNVLINTCIWFSHFTYLRHFIFIYDFFFYRLLCFCFCCLASNLKNESHRNIHCDCYQCHCKWFMCTVFSFKNDIQSKIASFY